MGATALFANRAGSLRKWAENWAGYLLTEDACTDVEAAAALYRAVDLLRDQPRIWRATAVLRVSIVLGDIGSNIQGYRLISTALFGDHYCIVFTTASMNATTLKPLWVGG